jgi:hypothetical protein
VSGRGHGLPRWLRRSLIALTIIVAVLVSVRLLLDPVATHFTRKALNDAEGIQGDFQSVHVTVFPPGYNIRRLKVVEHPGDDWKHPLFYAERMSVRVDWRALFHGRLAARARLDEPKFVISNREEKAKKKPAGLPDVRDALERVTPARVDRVEIRDGEILYRDLTAPRHPEIWVHRLELAVENIATREKLAHGQPVTVTGSAKLGRSGDLTLFVSANPFARQLEFAGETAVKGWKVAELYDLIEPATKLQTPEGTLDVFAEFRAEGGAITGGVKPVLKNVKVRPTDDDFGNKLKAWLADKGLHLFSDRVPGRNAVATVVPIKGKLDAPDIQLWPTVLGVVRNAFVEGISSGFTHLPPATAEKPEGKVEQVKNALKKDEGPPKAQPTPAETKAAQKQTDKQGAQGGQGGQVGQVGKEGGES